MGTNYYYYNKKPCPQCGRTDDPMHIGKSSAGWCFSLHVEPGIINNLDDWRELFKKDGSFIKDEYGHNILVPEMLKEIEQRAWARLPDEWYIGHYKTEADFHEFNHSERGSNGLLRHKIDSHCIGHGKGTWDLFAGEFC